MGPLKLLAFESLFATGLTAIVGTILSLPILVTQDAFALGIPLAVCMAILLTCCHGASAVPLTDYRAQVSHSVLIVVVFGLTIGVGFASHSPSTALSSGALGVVALSSLIAHSPG